jgi:hypothetical protein
LKNKNGTSEMKRTLIALLAVAVIGGILFSGCVAPPPEAPDTAEPTPEETPMPTDPDRVFIRYERSGGIMGIYDQLTIYSDGRCELQRELPGKSVYRESTIPPSQVEHLRELMEEANFLDLKGTSGPPPGADFIECVISYYPEEGKMHSVRTVSGAGLDALEPISIELRQLMEQIYSTIILVRYRRYGGIAGLDDELAIYTDGRCELRREDVEWEFTISPSQLEHLKEVMEEANFLDLKVPDLPPPGADLIEYVIYYNPEVGKNNTVRVRTTAIPDALLPIIYELDQLISSNS